MSERIVIGCDAVHPDRRGGQHVAKRCTGVLIIDDERGLGVMCNSERSQFGNRERASAMLAGLDRAAALSGDDMVILAGVRSRLEANLDNFPAGIHDEQLGLVTRLITQAREGKGET